ncbi:regulatory protein, gntR family [Streptomyces sp. BpilaLS-43]|uniref:GntR family transcriptional regulator n=1 Tax=Streptomyces sp. BpilaLS-43 TaxID=1839778 RepID=UPI00081B5637|nr:GntR family transcriptional regulator [Streptomyces sp. BpilaLS-43]SCD93554.1 regulatory protein, gntR family [Streptomyces sp. BpilaLS-43]
MTKRPSSDTRPPYRRVADVLRDEIQRGALQPGQQLPSHRELQERFEVANMTARSALRVLRDEGLIHTVQGRGSFVLAPEGEGAGDAERPDESTGDYTPPAWYTMQVGRKELWTGPGAPVPLRELLKRESKPEPGTLTRPDASPEFNALAQQVEVLTQRVDQLTQLFQQVLEEVRKPDAP